MAETPPDPNVDKTVTGKEAWFNEDARFYNDVYIYGNLYYDFDSITINSLTLGNLNVTTQAILKDLNVTGIATFTNQILATNAVFSGIATFTQLDVDNIDVGIATVRERFELTNEDGTNHVVGFATGTRAGRIGIGSTTPEQRLDIGGSIKIDENIFDSVNSEGQDGFFLSRDAGGIRWTSQPPNAEVDGVFIQNEGVLVSAATSFSTINFIGTGSGDDLVFATQNATNPNTVVDVSIISYWLADDNGINTTRNVGIGSTIPREQLDIGGNLVVSDNISVANALNANKHVTVGTALSTKTLNVVGLGTIAFFDSTNVLVSGISTFNGSLDINDDVDISGRTELDETRIDGNLDVTGVSTFRTVDISSDLEVSGFSTFTNFVDINDSVDISQDLTVSAGATINARVELKGPVFIGPELIVAGFTTGTISTALFANTAANVSFAQTAGIATFAQRAGIATVAGIGSTAVSVETFTKDNDQFYFFPFVENSTGTFGEQLNVDAGPKYNPSSDTFEVPNLTVGVAATINSLAVSAGATIGGATTFHGSAEFDSFIIDINGSNGGAGTGRTDYRLTAVGAGVSWRPPGVQTTNLIYVSVDGNDANSGLLEGDAKASIGGAAAIAQDGDTIYVRPGTYFENNPIGLRTDVSIVGQDLRLVTVVPKNADDDLFHVRRGCLLESMNFAGNNVATGYSGAMVAFPPPGVAIQNSGYIEAGPVNEGPSGRWRSPYVRNCTNFATNSTGMRIDGDHANAAFSGTNNLGQDLKSMVVDSYTQYNENGIGVSITNKGYAQLVSIFTINSKIAIFAGGGGQCDLTNSNSSFGIFGLVADGTSPREFVGVVTTASVADNDTFVLDDVRDTLGDVRKPFDGQGAFFMIDLADYTDVGGATGIVTEPLRTVRTVTVTNGGSGYSQSAPPNVTISEPLGPEPTLAELSANVSAAGTITSIDVIASGRNFLPTQQITVSIAGNGGAVAIANTDPILFTVNDASTPTTSGLTTVTFDQFVPYSIGAGVTCEFRRLSRVITSSHSFEYVGAGTDINRANPFQGGEPIPANEVVAINGGQIPFTSTDQKGNFRIGAGLVIDQTTASISGRDFNRAIQANLTPLILALGG